MEACWCDCLQCICMWQSTRIISDGKTLTMFLFPWWSIAHIKAMFVVFVDSLADLLWLFKILFSCRCFNTYAQGFRLILNAYYLLLMYVVFSTGSMETLIILHNRDPILLHNHTHLDLFYPSFWNYDKVQVSIKVASPI